MVVGSDDDGGEDGDALQVRWNILKLRSTCDLNSVTFESRIGFSKPLTPILGNKSSSDPQIRTAEEVEAMVLHHWCIIAHFMSL